MSIETIVTPLMAGLIALKDYIALHVITCLIPAFLLAGAIVTFVSKESIIGYLGSASNKIASFAVAAGGSFLVSVCSCTVIPVASGIYYGGAGVGAAFILLWVAPAANILALVYTGSIIGAQMAITRVIAALSVSFAIGAIMVLIFREEEQKRSLATQYRKGTVMDNKDIVLILLLVVSLLAPNYAIRSGLYLYKVLVWAVAMAVVALYVWRVKSRPEIKRWLQESWWFVRTIFPLLLVGVFIIGIIGALLPQQWIERWVGGEGLKQSFLASLTGAIVYFATLTEAPFVATMMNLGMGKGPALALLLTGPGISLPSWLAIAKVFGMKKALVYIPAIIILGTLVGWIAGFILS